MAYHQSWKRIGEGDAGQCRGVCHFGARFHIPAQPITGTEQVTEHIFTGDQRETIGIVGCVQRDVSVQRVGQNTDPSGTGQSLWQVHHVVRINNGDGGQQRIVSQRPFPVCGLIGKHCKRGVLRSGPGGGGDGNKNRLPSTPRNLTDPLVDIQEGRRQVLPCRLGMLVGVPHQLRRVQRGCLPAQPDDPVRLEFSRAVRPF